MRPIAHNKGKEPIIHDDVDTPANDELSSASSSPLSLSLAKDTRGRKKAKSHKRPSQHLAITDAVSGASRRTRTEAVKRQNQPAQALGNVYCVKCSRLACRGLHWLRSTSSHVT